MRTCQSKTGKINNKKWIKKYLMYLLELFRRLVVEDIALWVVEDLEADGEMVVFKRRLVVVPNSQFGLGVDLISEK